ncbi:protein kinase [Streptosporangium lutulentum]
MEYLPEGSLAHPAEPPSRERVLRSVACVARAAQALHEEGIVHGDIRPGNVLLTELGGKLSDLGLSRVLTPGVTVTGMGDVGSVEFADPAMLQGEAHPGGGRVVPGRDPAPDGDRRRPLRRAARARPAADPAQGLRHAAVGRRGSGARAVRARSRLSRRRGRAAHRRGVADRLYELLD